MSPPEGDSKPQTMIPLIESMINNNPQPTAAASFRFNIVNIMVADALAVARTIVNSRFTLFHYETGFIYPHAAFPWNIFSPFILEWRNCCAANSFHHLEIDTRASTDDKWKPCAIVAYLLYIIGTFTLTIISSDVRTFSWKLIVDVNTDLNVNPKKDAVWSYIEVHPRPFGGGDICTYLAQNIDVIRCHFCRKMSDTYM